MTPVLHLLRGAIGWLVLASLLAAVARADTPAAAEEDSMAVVAETAPEATSSPLEPLVPELAAHPYRLAPGPREFQNRLSFSPGYGALGTDALFVFRLAYNPDPWLGYEASIAHNPGQSVHAMLHTFNAIVRHPLPGRFQPYGAAGYGMMLVFPGTTVNAKPVTKNALTVGGGLEFYIRSDLALRADARYATVFGRQRDRDGVVVYDYLQETIGLSFYRTIRP